MASWETLQAFALATFVFAVMPGPAILYTAARTVAGGRAAGFSAVIGIHLGCYAHVVAATLGLSAIFAHSPTAYAALKIAGAVYLCWLGARLLFDAAQDGAPNLNSIRDAARGAPKSPRRAFLESIIVEILNPKAALFFIAFLPQFVDPAGAWPVWAQVFALGVIVACAFSATDVLTVVFTARLIGVARSSQWGARVAKAVGGSVLVGLGAHLATSRGP